MALQCWKSHVTIFSNQLWLSRVTIGHANYTLSSVNKSEFGETHRKDNLCSKTS